MTSLRRHDFPLYDEERYNLHAALEDFWYARRFLRRVGEEERERFSEAGWYYGDPSYFGGSVLEIHELQLSVVLHSLFGDAVSGELFLHYVDPDEKETFSEDVAACDGGPVVPSSSPYAPADPEEVMIVELRGEGWHVAELEAMIRRSEGEGTQTRFFRWRPGSERAGLLAGRAHLLLLFGSELHAPQELVHDVLFEGLIRAWEVRRRG